MVIPSERNLTPEDQEALEKVVRGEGPFTEADPEEIKRLTDYADQQMREHDDGMLDPVHQRMGELEARVALAEQVAHHQHREEHQHLIVDDFPRGVAQIDSNDGSGVYTITQMEWNGSALATVAATRATYQISATESSLKTTGVAADKVLFWQEPGTDGPLKTFIHIKHLPEGTSGDVLYRSATTWAALNKGSDGEILELASGLPSWVAKDGKVKVSANDTTPDELDAKIVGDGTWTDTEEINDAGDEDWKIKHIGPDTGTTYSPIDFGGTGNHAGDHCYPIVDGRGHVVQYIMDDGTTTTAYTYSGGTP